MRTRLRKNGIALNVKYIDEFAPGTFPGARYIGPCARYEWPDHGHDKLCRESIEIEEAYITNETPFLNPYLSAAINDSRRGSRVRVLLDSYWYNVDGRSDNDEMVALINRIGSAERIPLEARCADLESNRFRNIDNKGVIVDGRKVLVSSINWNSNSPDFNREAGVIVDHPERGAVLPRCSRMTGTRR